MFSSRRERREQEHEAVQAQLYQQIGQLKVEVDWLKKKLDWPPDAKRRLLEPAHPQISLARQCALLGVSRSSVYYRPRGEGAENLHLMRLLDEQYTRTPFYGVRRMTAWLRQQGDEVNPKRVARLMQTLGLKTIYPRPRTPPPPSAHRVYPYWLRGLPVRRPHHVWSTDSTDIRLQAGCVYLVAMMDWFSRDCAVVGRVHYNGCRVLSGSAGTSAGGGHSGNL